jgi:hypothetical protein
LEKVRHRQALATRALQVGDAQATAMTRCHAQAMWAAGKYLAGANRRVCADVGVRYARRNQDHF